MNFWERLDRDYIFKYFSYKVFEIYTKLQDNFSQISLFFLLIIVLDKFDNCYYRRDRVWGKKNSVEFNQFRPSYRLFRIRGAFRARKFRSERNGTRVSRSVAVDSSREAILSSVTRTVIYRIAVDECAFY